MWKTLIIGLGLALALGASAQNDNAKLEQIKKAVQAKLPPKVGDVESVTKTNYLGLYEVYAGGELLYTDENVNFLFLGDIIEAKTLTNLTEERKKKLTAIKFDTLPLNLALKQVRGNGKRKMAVFSDPDCPFCKRLEKQIAGLTDVTIYTFLYPIESLHPNAPAKSKDIWCSNDKVKTWYDFMLRDVAIPKSSDCANPIDEIQAFSEKYRIRATPTLVFADGRVVPGAIPLSDVEKLLGGDKN